MRNLQQASRSKGRSVDLSADENGKAGHEPCDVKRVTTLNSLPTVATMNWLNSRTARSLTGTVRRDYKPRPVHASPVVNLCLDSREREILPRLRVRSGTIRSPNADAGWSRRQERPYRNLPGVGTLVSRFSPYSSSSAEQVNDQNHQAYNQE